MKRRMRWEPDLSVRLGEIALRSPIVAASGTFGYGSEFATIVAPQTLGAVTVKSLASFAHDGNPPLRTTEATGGGMLNSVGLAGPGVEAWIRDQLPQLVASGATIFVSIWGRSVQDYAEAAASLQCVAGQIAAIEVNLSCPNLGGHEMFAQSAELTRTTIAACAGIVPVFAKLTAQVTDVVAIARAALDGGAHGLTLINTLPGLMIDVEARRPMLGAGGGGVSGSPIHAVALRTVRDVADALPGVPIIGTGGVHTAAHAVAMMLAGATAVGVGTATFANPRATLDVQVGLARWCYDHNVRSTRALIGELQWPS